MANLLKNLCCVDNLASLGFRNGRQKISFLRGVECKCLVTLASQYGHGGSIGQVFGLNLNHAIVNFASGD